MPLYEYQCTACGHGFEQIQKVGARAPRCPACGARTRKQISSAAIQFKGTGWYLTDYARKGKSGSETGGDGGGSGDGGATPKPGPGDQPTAAGGATATEKNPAGKPPTGKGSTGKGSAGPAGD